MTASETRMWRSFIVIPGMRNNGSWSLVEHYWHSDTPENHWTAHDTFWKSTTWHVSDISKSLSQIISADCLTANISKQLHICHGQEAYQFDDRVGQLHQCLIEMTSVLVLTSMRKHWQIFYFKTDVVLTQQKILTHSPLPIYGKLHAVSICDISCIIRRSCFSSQSQQLQHLRETHVHGVFRSTKLSSLRQGSVGFSILNFR